MDARTTDALKLVRVKSLVIGSGGTNGVFYAGALVALEELGLLSRLTHYYGTSVGALLATMLSVGYTARQIQDIATSFDFSLFIVPSLVQALERRSLMDVERWVAFLRHVFRRAGLEPDVTFAELHAKTNKTLGIVGYNLTTHSEELFGHETTPDMPVWKAIQISSAIPVFTAPVEHNGHKYVDGAVCNPLPMGHSALRKTETLGLDIHDLLPAEPNIRAHSYITMLYNHMKRPTTHHRAGNVVRLTVDGDADQVNFFRSQDVRQMLAKAGYDMCRSRLGEVLNKIIAYNIREHGHTVAA